VMMDGDERKVSVECDGNSAAIVTAGRASFPVSLIGEGGVEGMTFPSLMDLSGSSTCGVSSVRLLLSSVAVVRCI
jgi:hypothetical protein